MQSADFPKNEAERLAALKELNILDTLEEQAYDDLTALAATICGTPIALVSLLDSERQWFKSHHGLDATETPREFAFCGHAILQDETFYIPNSDEDERFKDNPLVTGAPHVKFYAGQPLYVKDKYKVGTLCVIDNEARELSEEQLNALKALARQVESQLDLRLKVKELQQLDQLKDDFVAMTSHELKTPLTAVSGAIKMFEKNNQAINEEKRRQLIEIAAANCERLEALVSDIIDTSMLASGNMNIEMNEQHINLTIEHCVEMMSQYFQKCDVTVDCHLDPNLQMMHYDEKRIMQVLSNLLSNAAKFSPEGSAVTISTQLCRKQVEITVADKGDGIPKDKRSHLFEKFSKIHHGSNDKIKSTGLGLYISKKIIELHGGTIEYKDNKPTGSIFKFTLPELRG